MFKLDDGRKPIKNFPNWIIAILVLVYIMSVVLMIIPKTSAEPAFISDHYIQHTVSPGETLYSISRHYHPNDDWRRVAYEIREVNDITPLIYGGQVILVPEVGK